MDRVLGCIEARAECDAKLADSVEKLATSVNCLSEKIDNLITTILLKN